MEFQSQWTALVSTQRPQGITNITNNNNKIFDFVVHKIIIHREENSSELKKNETIKLKLDNNYQ